MASSELSEEVQRFIADYIESVEKLEILLLLQSAPEKSWSSLAVYQRIQSSEASVQMKLRILVSEGLLHREADNSFRFQPRTNEMANVVQELKSTYERKRIKVIEAIFSKSTEELRRFADAFRIRKEEE